MPQFQNGIDFDDLWDLHMGLSRIRAAFYELKDAMRSEKKDFNPAHWSDD